MRFGNYPKLCTLYVLLLVSDFNLIGQFDSLFLALSIEPASTETIHALNTLIESSLYQYPQETLRASTRLDSIISQSDDLSLQAMTKNILGLAYYVNQLYDKAIEELFNSMRLFEQISNQEKIARVSNSLAVVYQVRKEPRTSAKYWEQAMAIYEELNDSVWIATIAGNLGGHYMEHDELDKADTLLSQACAIFEKLGQNIYLGYANLNQGSLRVKQQRPDDAITSFNRTFKLIPYESNPLIHAVAYTGIGNAYLDLKQMGSARINLHKGYDISIEIDQEEQQRAATILLSRYYEETKDFEQAYLFRKEWSVLQDSFLTASEDDRLVEALSKYETEKKEQEIVLLSAENEIKDLRLGQSSRNMLFAGIGILSLGCFAFYFYNGKKRIQILNVTLIEQRDVISKALKEKEDLLKEIHHRVKNNLQVISSLLKLQSKSVTDDKAKRALNEGRNRVRSMALIHQNLYQDESNPGEIIMQDYIDQLTSELFESYKVNRDQIRLELLIDDIALDVDTVVPIGLIINELVSNSIKYGFPKDRKGTISIKIEETIDSGLLVEVNDNGIGYDEGTISSKSFGLRLVRAFAERLNAEYSNDGRGGAYWHFLIKDDKLAA